MACILMRILSVKVVIYMAFVCLAAASAVMIYTPAVTLNSCKPFSALIAVTPIFPGWTKKTVDASLVKIIFCPDLDIQFPQRSNPATTWTFHFFPGLIPFDFTYHAHVSCPPGG
jgi:hypothetical protein